MQQNDRLVNGYSQLARGQASRRPSRLPARCYMVACQTQGFTLWQSKHTPYGVQAATNWRGGKGDVLKEFVAAAKLAVGETVILLHPPLSLVGVSIWMERGCQ